MFANNQVALTRLRTGESGIIVQIAAGYGLINRLSALGIRPGKRITKVSSIMMRGPVTIEIDRTRVALGYSMANRVLINPDNMTER